VPVAPRFTSVIELRGAFERLLADPAALQPDREARERALRERFGPDPARAAEAIAGAILRPK
jgi:hypothetical protein